MTDPESPSRTDPMQPAEGNAFDDQAALSFEIAAMRVRASWDDLGPALADVAASSDAYAPAQVQQPSVVSPSARPSASPAVSRPPAAVSGPPAAAPAEAEAFPLQQTTAAERLGAFAPISADDESALAFRRAKPLGQKQRSVLFAVAGAIACAGLWAAFSSSSNEPELPSAAAAPSVDSATALGAGAEAPTTALVNSNGASPRPQAARPAAAREASELTARPSREERANDNRLRDNRREARNRENEARKRRVVAPEPARNPRASSDLESARAAAARKRPLAETRPEPKAAPQRVEPTRPSDAAKRKGTGFVSTNPY